MEKPMYFLKVMAGQIHNRGSDKLLIKPEVKVATPNTFVGLKDVLHWYLCIAFIASWPGGQNFLVVPLQVQYTQNVYKEDNFFLQNDQFLNEPASYAFISGPICAVHP